MGPRINEAELTAFAIPNFNTLVLRRSHFDLSVPLEVSHSLNSVVCFLVPAFLSAVIPGLLEV